MVAFASQDSCYLQDFPICLFLIDALLQQLLTIFHCNLLKGFVLFYEVKSDTSHCLESVSLALSVYPWLIVAAFTIVVTSSVLIPQAQFMQVHLTELRPGRAAVNHCTSEAECRTHLQVYYQLKEMKGHTVVSVSLNLYSSGELFLATPGEHLGMYLGGNLEPFLQTSASPQFG